MKTNLIILLLCLNFWASAQDNKVVDITAKGVKIGEKVPDALISNVLNYKSTSFKLSDFKGKWVIIDFWATWCGACINMRPTMQKLATQFEDKLTFISVTYQTEAEVKPFFDKQKVKSNIPEVLADNLLHDWFPHRLLPHYVWIDPSGIVRAITGSDAINETKVLSVFSGRGLDLKTKRDLQREFDVKKNLSIYSDLDSTIKVQYQSSLTKYISGVPGETYSLIDKNIYKMGGTNLTLFYLYRIAYSKTNWYSTKMMKLEVNDTTRVRTSLRGTDLQNWLIQNAYCYQILVDTSKKNSAHLIMQKDLALLFPEYKATVIQKEMPCWTLEIVGDTSLLHTNGGKPFIDINDNLMVLKNAKISVMIRKLTQIFLSAEYPLFLPDHLNVRADLEINANLRSIKSINKELLKYGLAFVNRSKIQDVLVISDNLP